MDGTLDPWAAKIVEDFQSYAEVSPSGTGVKIFVSAALPAEPKNKRKDHVEMYDRGRYFAVTGHRVPGTPASLSAGQGALEQLHAELFPEKPREQKPTPTPRFPSPTDASDNELLERARQADNGAKFKRLFDHGDTSGYDGDDSRADMALCGMIAFWTGPDPARIDALFQRSALMRDKWDRRTGDTTYGRLTIDKVLAGRTDFYRGQQPGNSSGHERAPGHGASPTSANPPSRLAHEIILDHLRAVYDPTFRRGTVIFSGAQGREVKPAEVLLGAPSVLIEAMAQAADARRDQHGRVERGALPGLFKRWAPTAWKDLLAALPDEESSPEVSDLAREEFRARVAAALCTLVALAYKRNGASRTDDVEVQRRPLIAWARLFASKANTRWADVRGHALWVRKVDGVLRVALRAELFSQLHLPDLGRMPYRQFAKLATLYEVGSPVRVCGGDHRAIELTREFEEDLLAGPIEEAPQPGDQDGRADDSLTHAHTREGAS